MSEMFRSRSAHVGHVGRQELALYVVDALDPARKMGVESHVFSCEECAQELAREARLEAAFEQVACVAGEREVAARVVSIMPAIRSGQAGRSAAGQ